MGSALRAEAQMEDAKVTRLKRAAAAMPAKGETKRGKVA